MAKKKKSISNKKLEKMFISKAFREYIDKRFPDTIFSGREALKKMTDTLMNGINRDSDFMNNVMQEQEQDGENIMTLEELERLLFNSEENFLCEAEEETDKERERLIREMIQHCTALRHGIMQLVGYDTLHPADEVSEDEEEINENEV